MNTWDERDLPVLRSVVRLIDQRAPGGHVEPAWIVKETGLSERDVQRALVALNDDYLGKVLRNSSGAVHIIFGIKSDARRVTDGWPRADLIAVIDQQIAITTDPDQKSNLQKARGALVDLGTKLVSDIAAKLITGAI